MRTVDVPPAPQQDAQATGPVCDLALLHGRVIDPETGLDSVLCLGTSGGIITYLAAEPPTARRTLDCAGLVVAPGFIDLHSHAQSLTGSRIQALDGVTTAVDLESGVLGIAGWLAVIAQQGRPINYGYSASWAVARAQVLAGHRADPQVHHTGLDAFGSALGSTSWQRPADRAALDAVLGLVEEDVEAGALGIGIMLGYLPDTDRSEYQQLGALAARLGTGTFTHVRSAARTGPVTAVDAVREVTLVAAQTGAPMHVCHAHSTSGGAMQEVAALITDASARGLPVSTEVYPYERGCTVIGAEFLEPQALHEEGWAASSLIYLPTGEIVKDDARLRQLRCADPAALVLTLTFDPDDPAQARQLDQAMAWGDAAFASDAMPVGVHASPPGRAASPGWPVPPGARAHPRSAGCFARVFRWLVRERELITLAEAVRRCTLLPADVLAQSAPAMRRKGRLQLGMDADVVAFDPDTITDRATYRQPQTSTGVTHLVVGGTPVVIAGSLCPDALPGSAIIGRNPP